MKLEIVTREEVDIITFMKTMVTDLLLKEINLINQVPDKGGMEEDTTEEDMMTLISNTVTEKEEVLVGSTTIIKVIRDNLTTLNKIMNTMKDKDTLVNNIWITMEEAEAHHQEDTMKDPTENIIEMALNIEAQATREWVEEEENK